MPNFNLKIHQIVMRGSLADLQKAIDIGLNVNMQNVYGETPLMLAAHTGNFKAFKLLYRSGGLCAVSKGRTILHHAALGGSKSICQYLVSAGHPADIQDEGGKTPADVAHYNGYFDLAEWFATPRKVA